MAEVFPIQHSAEWGCALPPHQHLVRAAPRKSFCRQPTGQKFNETYSDSFVTIFPFNKASGTHPSPEPVLLPIRELFKPNPKEINLDLKDKALAAPDQDSTPCPEFFPLLSV